MLRKSNRVTATLHLRDAGVGVRLRAASGLSLGQGLVGQRLGAVAKGLDRRKRVVGLERAVVALVD
jgi:hypothetical protein